MAQHSDDEEIETTYSGEAGRRERSTPGRTPRELGLTADDVRGNTIGAGGDRFDADLAEEREGLRQNPPLTEGVEQLGTGGLSTSGGRAGGARGNAGRSDNGAGGPEGDSRSGPNQRTSTSRGDPDR
jgi:hypothetical protein